MEESNFVNSENFNFSKSSNQLIFANFTTGKIVAIEKRTLKMIGSLKIDSFQKKIKFFKEIIYPEMLADSCDLLLLNTFLEHMGVFRKLILDSKWSKEELKDFKTSKIQASNFHFKGQTYLIFTKQFDKENDKKIEKFVIRGNWEIEVVLDASAMPKERQLFLPNYLALELSAKEKVYYLDKRERIALLREKKAKLEEKKLNLI